MADKKDMMLAIKNEVMGLKKSPLYDFRVKNKNFPVIGEGSHDAKIMFIGEAPGRNEAKTGRPFCGAAGKILDELLESISVPRADVYVTNIVKDRPPSNRDPFEDEIDLYAPFLERQIEIIQPKIIGTLGRFSMIYLLKKYSEDYNDEPISIAHGKIFVTKMPYGDIKIIPLYHPAAAIYNRDLIKTLKEDFKLIAKNYEN